MTYFFYILSLILIIYQLISVLINFFFQQKIVRYSTSDELVSILIPARNEAKNIDNLLRSLQTLEDENIEIILCDDHSEDETYSIMESYAKVDKRIQYFKSKDLPVDWLGKNHACYQLAQRAKGDYYLYLDADVMIEPSLVRDSVGYAKHYDLALMSIFPYQMMESVGERVSVPMMNYILLTLLPLIFVRISPFASHSAANGQFMLFHAPTYKKTQPHHEFKHSPVEDIAISRYFKSMKYYVACITGEVRVTCRMYRSFSEAVNGFSKNIFMFFGSSAVLAFLFWFLCSTYWYWIFLYLPLYFKYFIIIGLVILSLYSLTSKQSVLLNIILYPLQLSFLFIVMIKALSNKLKKNYKWKGRNIYS